MQDCHYWAGQINSYGYGVYQEKLPSGKWTTKQAHRLLYEAEVGKIPKGLVINHLCKTTRCINTKHLEVCTQKHNVLTGDSPSANNAIKTHCPKGHKYTPANTYFYKGLRGAIWRHCKTCKLNSQKSKRKELKYEYTSKGFGRPV